MGHTATVDVFGRFVGPHDVERGAAFFWSAPHRRGAAPLVRSHDPFATGSGAPGQPRSLERSGLDFAKLREIHRRRQAGWTFAALAAHFGVAAPTLRFHLAGSASMRAALAAPADDIPDPAA